MLEIPAPGCSTRRQGVYIVTLLVHADCALPHSEGNEPGRIVIAVGLLQALNYSQSFVLQRTDELVCCRDD